MNKEIRWKQRFDNFQDAFNNLKEAIDLDDYSKLERAGLIQFFEFTYELSWNTLKDYLESTGISARTPKDTFKEAFKIGYIDNGHVWMAMLDERNNLSHRYDEEESLKAEELIRNEFFPAIESLYIFFKSKVDE